MRTSTCAGGLLMAALALAGCGTAAGTTPSAGEAAPGGAAAAAPAADTPPPNATMICNDELKSRIQASLHLDAAPATQATWADSLYSCTYSLPYGQFPLSVKVLPSDAAATSYLQAQRAKLPGAQETGGFGQEAYETDNGVILARKDTFVLRVDASKLPDSLGVAPTQERPIDFATVVASGIFNCWTEDSH